MKNQLLVSAVIGLACGCAQVPIQPMDTECGGPSNNPPTQISYGDSQIIVKAKSKVKANREFQFKLDPKKDPANDEPGIDYDAVLVTVLGKNAESSWISGSSTKDMAGPTGKFFGGCVPDDAVEGTIYRYEVRVETVGTIDPRAEVVN